MRTEREILPLRALDGIKPSGKPVICLISAVRVIHALVRISVRQWCGLRINFGIAE